MSSSSLSRVTWILFAALLWLLPAEAAHSFTYEWSAQSDKERMVLHFSGGVPRYGLERTGPMELHLLLPPDYWVTSEKPSSKDFNQSKLIESIAITDDGASIRLRTNGFGYIHLAENNRIILDVFADPMGARWEPSMGTDPQLAEAALQPPQDQAEQPQTTPQPQAEPQPPVLETGTTDVAQAPAALQQPTQEPSHDIRAPIRHVSPEEAHSVTQPAAEEPPASPGLDSVESSVETGSDAVAPPAETEPAETVPAQPEQVPEVAESPQPETLPQQAQTAPLPQDTAPNPSEVRRPFLRISQEEAEAMLANTPPEITPPPEQTPQETVEAPETQETVESVEQPAPPETTEQVEVATPETPEPPETQETPETVETVETLEPDQPGEVEILSTAELMEVAERLQSNDSQAEEDGEEPMPDFATVLTSARASIANGEYEPARQALEGLNAHPLLPDDLLEEVTYSLADCYYNLAGNDYNDAYDKIIDTYDSAITISQALSGKLGEPSPFSYRIPEALLRMGAVNLWVDNFPLAEAYFNMLRRNHPNDQTVPAVYYALGQYYQGKGNFQEAANNYDIIVQKYPDHRLVRSAALGLSLCLDKLGYIDQAVEIIDFIEQRWPRFYEEDPSFLTVSGSIHFKNDDLEKARDRYWTYYNILPDAPDADIVLARLGDIYLRSDPPLAEPATEVYTRAATLYPDSEGGLIAQMRLAENGVLDSPTYQNMFTVFDKVFTETPAEVYTRIVTEYPDSMLAPLAQLKLSMWHLFNGRTIDSIKAVDYFHSRYPDSPLLPNAQATAMEAFSQSVEALLPMEDYKRITGLWDGNAILHDQEENLEPNDRIALAMSYWKSGYPEMALFLVKKLFDRPGMPEHSEEALTLALNIMLDSHDWQGIVDLERRIQHWELTREAEREYMYILALAYENLDMPDMSRPLWIKLAGYTDTEPSVRAYTLYFLALEARDRSELKSAYDNAQLALSMFRDLEIDDSKVRDLLILLADITETADRTQEALKWTQEYAAFIDESDPAWPALRYRMARLYKKSSETGKWREILEDLSTRMPDTLYGRMAASELETYSLEVQAQDFVPQSTL